MIIIDKNAKREVQVKYPDRTRVLFPNLDDGYISSNDIVIPSIDAPISDGGVAEASINDGAEGGVISKLVIGIEPVQDLHGQSNPYPAGGGKNLLPMTLANLKAIQSNSGSWNGNTYTLYGVSYTINVDDGGNVVSVTVNGTASQYSLFRLVNEWTSAEETILSGTAQGSSGSSYRLQAEGDATKQDLGSGVILASGYTATRIIIVVPQGASASNAVFKPMIRLSSVEDATFAPYSNICTISGWSEAKVTRSGDNSITDTYTIDLNGTRYGGTLDVTTGVLTVDRVYKELSSNIPWQKSGSYPGGFYSPKVNFAVDGHEIKSSTPFMCSHAKSANNLSEYLFGACYMDGSVNIRIMEASTTVEQWGAYLDAQITANTPVSCCFVLDSPFTVTLTAQEVTTLLGNNAISADCGNVMELSYSANMNIRLQDLLDEKLDKPTTPGTLGQVLTSDGEGGQTWETPE